MEIGKYLMYIRRYHHFIMHVSLTKSLLQYSTRLSLRICDVINNTQPFATTPPANTIMNVMM